MTVFFYLPLQGRIVSSATVLLGKQGGQEAKVGGRRASSSRTQSAVRHLTAAGAPKGKK